jgi:hypothetical protein
MGHCYITVQYTGAIVVTGPEQVHGQVWAHDIMILFVRYYNLNKMQKLWQNL